MKLVIDPLIFDLQRAGGISRYVSELLSGLKNRIDLNIPLLASNNIYVKKNTFISKRMTLKSYHLKRTISFLNKNPDAIFHPSYYDQFFLNEKIQNNIVITVHDFIVESFPELFNENERQVNEIKRKLIEKAARIISVSQETKKDILKHCQVDESKIDVIYHGSRFDSLVEKKIINLPEKYLLYVGSRYSYKNFLVILQQFAEVVRKMPNLFLICASPQQFNDTELSEILKLNMISNVKQISCLDSELKYLYSNAIGLIFPSKMEGFGIPIIEAFQSNCPVILSNIPVFHEIAQDAAIYIDPENYSDLIYAIEILLNDSSFRAELIRKGNILSKNFSWEKTVDQTLSTYSKVFATEH